MENHDVTSMIRLKSPTKWIWFVSLFFFLLMIMEIPLSFVLLHLQGIVPEKYSELVRILVSQGYFLLGGLFLVFIFKISFVKDLELKKYRLSSFFLSLLVLITAMPMATWLNLSSQLFTRNEMGNFIIEMSGKIPVYVAVLVIGCLPGFIEEFLYRGILFTAFKKYSVLVGVIVSALCFGFMHMNFNQMIYAVYLGIIFALLVEVTGSLASTMILHMLFNAINVLYIYILPKFFEIMNQGLPADQRMDLEKSMSMVPEKEQLLIMMGFTLPAAIGGLVLTIFLLKQIAKMNGKVLTWASLCEKKNETIKKRTVCNIFLILGLAFCLVNAIFA